MRKSMLIGGLVLAFLCGFAGAWALQEEGGEEQWTPPPPLEDEWLDRLVGEWAWTGKMWMGGQELPMTATETEKWGLNHQFIISDYTSPTAPGQPDYKGHGLTRMDPETKVYTSWWFDVHGSGDKATGKREGDTIVFEGENNHGKTKSTYTVKADGTATHVREVLMTGQTEWTKFFDLEGKKKGS